MKRLVLALAFVTLGFAATVGEYEDARQCGANNDDPELKIQFCSRAIDSGELSADELAIAYRDRGLAFWKKRQYGRVITEIDNLIRLRPDNASAYLFRGDAYYNTAQYDRAINDLDTVIRLDPDFAGALVNRGMVHQKQGRMKSALQDYRRAYGLGPRQTWMIKTLEKHGMLP